MIWIMIIIFFLFMIIGLPIAFSMGISALIYILSEGIPLSMVAQKFFTNTQSFPFLAVPFFILSGNLMVQSGVANKIIKFANSIIVCVKFLWVLFSAAKMFLVLGRPTLQVRKDYDSLKYTSNTLLLFNLQSYILNLLSLIFYLLLHNLQLR